MHRAPRRGRVVVARDAASKRTPRSGAKGFRLRSRANVRAWFVSLRARDAATRALDAPNGFHACIRARARATASSRATRRRARMPCRARVARASDREREGDGRTYPHGVART